MYELDEPYEPSEEEQKEINEILNKEEFKRSPKSNRIIYYFNSEDHWIGWLKTHGIKW